MNQLRFAKICILVSITTAAMLQCIGAWQDSQTTDEAVHLSAGMSYWQTGEFRLNPEHPALFKLWAALPLLLDRQARVDTSSPAWINQDQWAIGRQFLYQAPPTTQNDSQRLMFFGRLPMILIWLGGVLLMTCFTWRRYGPWPSVAVTALTSFDPNLLGHGHLVTNDVFTAFAYLGVCIAIDWVVQRVQWQRVLIFSFLFAIAQLTKFSAGILWLLVPSIFGIAVLYRKVGMTWLWWLRIIMCCVLAFLVATWVVYGFRFTTISQDQRIEQLWQERADIIARNAFDTVPPYTQTFIRLSDPASLTGRAMQSLASATIPAYGYWRGFFSAASHNAYGHAGYVLGRTSNTGWWWYFPVALLFKTPLPLLLVVFAWTTMHMVRLVRKRFSMSLPFEFWVYGFPPIAFLLWSMTSHINIGVRHVLPTYIFFPLAGASLLHTFWQNRPKYFHLITLVLFLITASVGLSAWPHTIGYINALGGGTVHGHRVLLDSNIDWNQDFRRLQSFLRSQNLQDVQFALFGSIPIEAYFTHWRPVPFDEAIANGQQPSGVIAISDGQLYNEDGPFHWLRKYSPRWRIGSSINIFDFR